LRQVLHVTSNDPGIEASAAMMATAGATDTGGMAPAAATVLPLSAPFRQLVTEGEHCWYVALPQEIAADGDDNDDNRRSPWRLLEDGVAIGKPHTSHRWIGQIGRGCYSHWRIPARSGGGVDGSGLYFSTSDNSDPNVNGRHYCLALDRVGAVGAEPTRQPDTIAAAAARPDDAARPRDAVVDQASPAPAAPNGALTSPAPQRLTLRGSAAGSGGPDEQEFLAALPYVCSAIDVLVFRERTVRWDAIIPDFAKRSSLVSSEPVLERFPSAGEIGTDLALPQVSYEGISFPGDGAYNLLTQFGVVRILILPPVASAADILAIGRFFSANVVHSGFDVADCTDGRHVASTIYYPNLFRKLFRSDQPLGLICGQASMALCALYHTLGFPTRQVHFHGSVRGGHFSTEVFDGQRWFIVDPDFDCVVRNEDGQLVDADAIARALLLGEADRLRVESLSQKHWLKPSRGFLWGFYGDYTWRPDDAGPNRCSDSYLSQLAGMVVRRRDCSFNGGVLQMNWACVATGHANEPNTELPIAEQIDRQRVAIGRNRERAGLYEAAMARLDLSQNQKLIYQYGTSVGFDGPLKYLDCAYWLNQKLDIAMELGLHKSTPLRILDIGTGGGHFPFLCGLFGHDVVGIDIDVPIYSDICALLGVRRVSHRVERGVALPDLGGPFDLVTAFAAQFDAEQSWSKEDWAAFLDLLLATQLRAPGRIHFSLNDVWDATAQEWRFKHHVGEVFVDYGGRADPDRSVVELDVTEELIQAATARRAAARA
jgi:SAM-dependent methyltransferase